MKFSECVRLIKSDLQRLSGGGIRSYLWSESFKITFWLRIGTYLSHKHYTLPLLVVRLIYKHIQHKTGIQIPIGTNVGSGLRFFHHDCIIVAQSTVIGRNASIHQGVTIGRVFAGKKKGVPVIGDNVVICAGAKVLGGIRIGDNVVIGANAVVVNDVPSNAVVAGVPAIVISTDSTKCFDKNWGNVFAHPYNE